MKVVLAYSGGLDTSVILHWLQQNYNAEVIAFCADVGQDEDLSTVEQKAKDSGASKCIVEDLQQDFARDYVFPMMKANVVYEGTYLLGTSIARPLIAKRLVDIAHQEGATAICHGATGKGNDQARFELTAYALDPDIQIIAPWRTWQMQSRSDLLTYCREHGITVEATEEKPYSTDCNLLHVSFEGGILEDPWEEPPEDVRALTRPLSETPDDAEDIVISFKDGVPVSLNGQELSAKNMLTQLNAIAGKHCIGRIDIVENRFVGMKSRGIYETPGGTVLHNAHRAIESICMDREVMHMRDSLIPRYAELVYNGFWFSPERRSLQALVEESQKNVTGDVRCKLFKGACHVTGRRSEYSLYKPELATFEADDSYNQADAEGFIRLNALRLRVSAKQNRL